MKEIRLIDKIRSGDRDAFADIVREYQARVIRLCTSLLTDAALAEDAAQDIFLKAFRALSAFRGDAAFSTWLYRIAVNHCKDLLRRRAREKTESWDALVEKNGDQIQRLLAFTKDSSPNAADTDLVDKVLSCLSPDYRIILTLREMQGLSYEEIAQSLGCSLDAVKARLRRGCQVLQDNLRHFTLCGL